MNEVDDYQRTALHYALNKDVAQLLLSAAANASDLVLQTDQDNRTALHYARDRDIAQLLLSAAANARDLVLQTDRDNCTALHYARDRDVAQLLLSAAANASHLVLQTDTFNRTALHYAQDRDIAQLLLSAAVNASDLVLQTDQYNCTTLHFAGDRDIAQLLVQSVDFNKLKHLLWITSRFSSQTAFDKAVADNRPDVCEYLVGLTSHDNSLLKDGQYFPGYSQIYDARCPRTAKMLLDLVPAERKYEFLLRTDMNNRTVLHTAVNFRRDGLVKYLCSLPNTDLLLRKDKDGDTALHLACTEMSVQTLLESLPEDILPDYVVGLNNKKQTPLHTLVKRIARGLEKSADESAIEYLLNISQYSDEVLLQQDFDGRTALHYAYTAKRVDLLLNSAQTPLSCIRAVDNDGLNPLMQMIASGRTSALRFMLEYLEEHFSSDEVEKTFKMISKKRQNIFHLACISPFATDMLQILASYIDVKIENFLFPDIYGNTPLIYIIGTYRTSSFAQLIMGIPAWRRRYYLFVENKKGISCQSILDRERIVEDEFLEKILCVPGTSYSGHFHSLMDNFLCYESDYTQYFNRDADIVRVRKYALNEYSPLDLCVSSRGLPREQGLYFIDANNMSATEMQKELYCLDLPELQGIPKVL